MGDIYPFLRKDDQREPDVNLCPVFFLLGVFQGIGSLHVLIGPRMLFRFRERDQPGHLGVGLAPKPGTICSSTDF